MRIAPTRDLYPGPLVEPDFILETTPSANRRHRTRSQSRWVVGAVLAASSLVIPVAEASGSRQEAVAVEPAAATYAVPQIAEWKRWLQGLEKEDLDPAVLSRLRLSFKELIEPTGLIPGGMATPEGAYLLTWNFDEHHLEVELFPEHWDWFYRNRKTGRLAGDEGIVAADFREFREHLLKYAR